MCRKSSYLIPYVLALSVALTGTTKAELIGWWRFDEGSGTVERQRQRRHLQWRSAVGVWVYRRCSGI